MRVIGVLSCRVDFAGTHARLQGWDSTIRSRGAHTELMKTAQLGPRVGWPTISCWEGQSCRARIFAAGGEHRQLDSPLPTGQRAARVPAASVLHRGQHQLTFAGPLPITRLCWFEACRDAFHGQPGRIRRIRVRPASHRRAHALPPRRAAGNGLAFAGALTVAAILANCVFRRRGSIEASGEAPLLAGVWVTAVSPGNGVLTTAPTAPPGQACQS